MKTIQKVPQVRLRAPRGLSILFLMLVFLAGSADVRAQLQGVGYRLAPGVTYLSFDSNAGLANGYLFGGSLGISFGEFLELGAGYHLGSDFTTDFSGFTGLEAAPEIAEGLQALPARAVDMDRIGAELQLKLARGGLAPFLVGGAGLLRFDPEGLGRSERIFLSGGGGIQLTGADRYALAVQLSALTYRYNPGSSFFTVEDLAGVGLAYDNFNDLQVVNLSATATLRLYLGGRRPGVLSDVDQAYLDQFGAGLRGLSLQVHPFVSRLTFNDALPFVDQTFVGLEAGVNFGPLIGLRGFYGRGIEGEDPFAFAPVQIYGGNLQLRLSDATGIAPMLILGAGYIDVLEGYEAAAPSPIIIPGGGREATDRPFVMVGAGVEVPLDPRISLIADARALLMSEHDAGDISRPEQIFVSPMVRVGASFGLGRRAAAPDAVLRTELERRVADEREAAALRAAELEREIVRALQRGDEEAAARLESEQRLARRTALAPADDLVIPADEPADRMPEMVRRDERMATFPVPERGEIYIRYGDPLDAPPAPAAPGAPQTEEELRSLVREAIRDAVGATEAAAAAPDALLQQALEELLRRELERAPGEITAAEAQLLERRMLDRFYDELARLRADIATVDDRPIIIQQPPTVVPATGGTPVAAAPATIVSVLPITGFGAGRGANAANLGLRLDYRTPGAFAGIRYYPEVLIGFGGRSSVGVNLNAVIPFPQVGIDTFPYFGAGFGLTAYAPRDVIERDPFFGDVVVEEGRRAFLLGFNMLLGAEIDVGGNRFFGEVNSVNISRIFRMMGGYRFTF